MLTAAQRVVLPALMNSSVRGRSFRPLFLDNIFLYLFPFIFILLCAPCRRTLPMRSRPLKRPLKRRKSCFAGGPHGDQAGPQAAEENQLGQACRVQAHKGTFTPEFA